MQEEDAQEKPWYHEGLPFQCSGCGQCCTGENGYTWVLPHDIKAIAAFLKLDVRAFERQYLRRAYSRLALIDRPGTFDCVFLENKKCKIYPVRPVQCRTFPWWPAILSSPTSWEWAKSNCPGICPGQNIKTLEEIQKHLNDLKGENPC